MAVKRKVVGKSAAKKKASRQSTASDTTKDKSIESWIWDAACSIRGAKDAPKFKDYILPLIFTKRLCDVFDDEINRIADHAELKKNDYNISPSRYIHTSDAETYRPLAEIVADLDAVEAEARETDAALREILRKIGV